ncbi:aldo/keto reductase [Paenibacillus sp. IB182496]|uniref:Aldo/keto reductase n=1 Tax=Paenibacillus sabuli TaxID=2772509 RepID=A0A927BX35_9BACL|nr:aldo/keto reductase [Paenibacillus sabuli]MBD2847340.1 aldo/keto reductase [Paenibacillus sabuli]
MDPIMTDHTVLHNGVRMPWLGLGVYKLDDGEEVRGAVSTALEAGYRSIDTAAMYGNETGVGEAIRISGIPRDQVFVTTKIWNDDHGYDRALAAFEESRQRLGLEYVDLLLIHWPVKERYVDTWRALEKLYNNGLVQAIGVSNFQPHHLERVMDAGSIVPMVNQVELHPLLTQKELLRYTHQHQIQLEAWSPLMRGALDIDVLQEIGARHGKSPAQVILRWDVQNGVVVIPKSGHPERIRSNAAIFDFELTDEEMAQIDALDTGKRFGPDPDNFDF